MACYAEVNEPTDGSTEEDERKLLSDSISKFKKQKIELSGQIKRLTEHRSNLAHEAESIKDSNIGQLSIQIQKLNEQRLSCEREMESSQGFKNSQLSEQIQRIKEQVYSLENRKMKIQEIQMIEKQLEKKKMEEEEVIRRLHELTRDDEQYKEKQIDPKLPNDKQIELSFQRLDLENGIVIEGMFPVTFSCKAVPWNSSTDRFSITKDDSCPEGFNFETDIFDIRQSKTAPSLAENNVLCKTMRLTVTLPDLNTKHLHYKGGSMYQNSWHFLDPISQEGCLVFEVTQVESFCVISIIPSQNYMIPPSGGNFISTIDGRIQVIFPSGAVKKETMISFKVHPMNINCIKQISEEENMGAGLVCEISHGLSASHVKFRKPVMVRMPLQNIPGHSYDDKKYEYCVYKMEDEGSFELAPDVVLKIENAIASFEIISFSRYVAGGTTKSWDKKSRGILLDRAQGIKRRCKILFFVGKTEKRHIHFLIECVEWNKVEEISKKRKSLGFNVISDWTSKDLYLEPYKTMIAVELKGKFKIPKGSGIKQHKISFMPMAQDNYEHVVVELDDNRMSGHGIVSFFRDNKLLYEIFYDPARSIKVASSWSKPKSNKDQPKYLADAEFFTEIGLLDLAKLMDENTMFQVCIYMRMSKVEYDNIPKQSGVEKNFTLLQKALKQQPDGTKVQSLVKALKSAGEKFLAERVEKIWSAGKSLHTISGT